MNNIMAKDIHTTTTNQQQAAPIAIIGIGCIFPKARDLQEYWTNLKEGVDAITEIPETHWKPEEYFDHDPKSPDKTYAKRGGFLPTIDFDPLSFGILPNALEATDTSQLLSLVAAQEALRDAGYLNRELDRDRVSVIVGVTGTQELVIPLGARLSHPIWRKALKDAGLDDEVTQEVVERISQSYVEWQESSFPGLLGNVVAGRIANKFDLGGTNCVVDAACASSLSAIHLATMELTEGHSDMVLTGGVDTFNHIFMYICFSKTPALSPDGHARPFDHQCDGTTLGEGVGIIVLKRLEDAKRDGDKIYAVIKGIGASSDGKGNAIYAPSSEGQMKAFRRAYQHANVTPETIELIEAHGTGTKVGDAAEINSLTEIYKTAQTNGSWCALGSVKSQIGHTKAAAGIAGLIKATLALHHKVLPPTIKVEKPSPTLGNGDSPFYVNTEKRPWVPSAGHPRRAGVSSFGFGGSNFHCVLEEYSTGQEEIDWSGNTQILAFCAETLPQLQAALDEISPESTWDALRKNAVHLRNTFDHTQAYRLLLVVEREKSDLAKLLKNARMMLEKNQNKTSWSTPDGIFYGTGEVPGKLGIIFPGQGSQYISMLRDTACQFPQFQDILEVANRVFQQDQSDRRLSDLIYPHPTFNEEDFQKNAEILQSTQIAQPAIGAVSLGLLKVLEHFGIQPASVAGHSYGELVALCVAGVLDTETFFAMSKLRGQLMGQKSGDKGSMLAVQGDWTFVSQLIQEEQIALVIANKNSPQQTVLSGATSEVERAAALLKERDIRCKQLHVAAAFHSRFVSDASGAFLEALQQTEIHTPTLPVYADSTADLYPDDVNNIRELLAGQLANPVDFIGIIENMYARGVRTFLEVGPSSQMNGLIKAILEEKSCETCSVDVSKGSRSGEADLARALSQLAASGFSVRISAWDDKGDAADTSAAESTKRKMSIPLSGANLFTPRPPKPPVKRNIAPVSSNGAGSKKLAEKTFIQTTESSPSVVSKTQTISGASTQSQGTQGGISFQMKTSDQTSAQLQTQSTSPPVKNVARTSQSSPVSQSASQESPQKSSLNLSESLRMTQENLQALQQFQQQTADLHRQFLEGQEATRQTFERLFSQQQQLLLGGVQEQTMPSISESRESVPASLEYTETAAIPVEQTGQAEIAEIDEEVPVVPHVEPSALSSPTVNDAQVEQILLDVVSEKTGYPVDMLDLDMGLDADLGIDSIKRVEILSALQEQLPNAPEIRSDQIGQIQNLRQIVEFLRSAIPAEQSRPQKEQPEESGGTDATYSPAEPSGLDKNQVQTVLLQVVSEKTGYPEEMLDLDMGLDADLGIDSIKRVEILSDLQNHLPGAPEIGSDQLGQIQNLRQIVDFLSISVVSPPRQTASRTVSDATITSLDSQAVETTLLRVVAEKTGYPEEMLDLDMGLDADLGIDSIKRVEILSALQNQLPDAPEIQSDQIGQIQNLRQIVDFLSTASYTQKKTSEHALKHADVVTENNIVDEQTRELSSSLERLIVRPAALTEADARKQISITAGATIWVTDDGTDLTPAIERGLQQKGFQTQRISLNELSSVNLPDSLGGVLILTPPTADLPVSFLKDAFKLVQLAGKELRKRSSIFATVSRLDGVFGFNNMPPNVNALSGGLAGLIKTVRREWPEINSKAIDLAADFFDHEAAAAAILDEFSQIDPIEVGISQQGRVTLELEKTTLERNEVSANVTSQDVIVITGGARGVTAECAVALAKTFQPTIVLLGRSPVPIQEPAWLSNLSDEAEIKKVIISHADQKMTPKDVGAAYQRILSNREILNTLARIKAAGANALYQSVDVRDATAVRTVVDEVQQQFGTITGLIHGAGVLADRKIEDKTDEQFDMVYGTKVDGLRNFLGVLHSNPLKILGLFSSTTARLGRVGQVDYAIANEVLNKIAQQQATLRPACKVVSINWGPWAGGMVTPALENVFADEGIKLIPLQAGADYLVQELSRPVEQAAPVEIVILGKGTVLQTSSSKSSTDLSHREFNLDSSSLAIAFKRTLDIEQHPFLKSHVIDGRAVLPMAITIEWLAHAALHNNPGLVLHGFDELRILKGVILSEHESLAIQVLVGDSRKEGKTYLVPVEMRSVNSEGKSVLHARAEFILTTKLPQGERTIAEFATRQIPYQNGDIYQKYLFHGPDFHAIERVEGYSPEGIIGISKAAPHPSSWIKHPLRNHWITDPLIVDSSFQMMILWSFEQHQSGSLPTFVGRYRQFKPKFATDGGRIVAQVIRSDRHRALANIEILDHNGELIARLEDYECTIDPSLNEAFRRNQLSE